MHCDRFVFLTGAGNACVLKLSEIAVATSNLLAELIPSYLDKVKDVHMTNYNYCSQSGHHAV